MSDMGMLRRLYVERHARKGESWAKQELERERARVGRPPVWIRATVVYRERSDWGVVSVGQSASRTVVFRYRGDLGSPSELESAVHPVLTRLNRAPELGSIQFLAVKAYPTEETARAGVGAEF